MRSHDMSASQQCRWGRAKGGVRVMAAVDRRSWGILDGRFRAGGLATRRARPRERQFTTDIGNKVLPMFPVNFVTYVPGCTRLEGCRRRKARQGHIGRITH
jgi:hypothetical protein